MGASAFLMAQALKENGEGCLWTVDDGQHWPQVKAHVDKLIPGAGGRSHAEFIQARIAQFELSRQLVFHRHGMPPFPAGPEAPLDLLFSDYRHDPDGLVELLAHYLPRMAPVSSIFLDSASTFLPSYLLLEALIRDLSAGRVPRALLRGHSEAVLARMWSIAQQSRFTLVHLTERKDGPQNSMAWLKIEPLDLQPYPKTTMYS